MDDRLPGLAAIPAAIAPAARIDDDTLTAFVTDHYDRLLGLARLICRDATDAADAVQVGLEEAWRRRETLRDPGRVRSWLDRIVVREAIRISRRQRTWLSRLLPTSTDVAWIEIGDRSAGLAPEMTALRDAFAMLPPDQRAVVALHHHLGYSVAETATLVGAPLETVRTRLRRATDRLRRELEETER